jgi:hypothetical protein
MAHHQVVDGRDGLQIWRVAANILNKQLHTADRGWFFSRVGQRANNPHHKKFVTKYSSQDEVLLHTNINYLQLSSINNYLSALKCDNSHMLCYTPRPHCTAVSVPARLSCHSWTLNMRITNAHNCRNKNSISDIVVLPHTRTGWAVHTAVDTTMPVCIAFTVSW